MTNIKKSKIVGYVIAAFSIIIPLIITFLAYMSSKNTDSHMSMNLIGVFIGVGILFGAIKLIKRRIKIKKEIAESLGKPSNVSPYLIAMPYIITVPISMVLFTWFLWSIKSQIDTLLYVMVLIAICQFIAFGLKILQIHFDIKAYNEA